MDKLVHQRKPKGFKPTFEVASVFLEHIDSGKFLLLHRKHDRPQPNTYGVPAGKAKPRETPLQTIRRETFEETMHELDEGKLVKHKTVFVCYPEYDFTYHIFWHPVDGKKRPKVRIDPTTHNGYKWVTPNEALELPLVPGLDEVISKFYKTR